MVRPVQPNPNRIFAQQVVLKKSGGACAPSLKKNNIITDFDKY
jgi:hypothetical protein